MTCSSRGGLDFVPALPLLGRAALLRRHWCFHFSSPSPETAERGSRKRSITDCLQAKLTACAIEVLQKVSSPTEGLWSRRRSMRNSKKAERFTEFSKYERRLIFLPVAFLVVSGGLSVFPGALFGTLVHGAHFFLRKGRGEVLEKS